MTLPDPRPPIPTSGSTTRGLRRRVSLRLGSRRVGMALGPLLVLLLVVVGSLSAWLVLGSSVFGVQTIAVEGVRAVAREQVVAAAKVEQGSPLATLDTGSVSQNVGRIPEVERAEVFRSWPRTLRIVITERRAVAVAEKGNSFLLVDASGVAFKTVREKPALPVVEVRKLRAGDATTLAALEVARALTPQLLSELDNVTAQNPNRVSVILADGRTIFWGGSSENDRKARVATALLGRPGNHIDVSAADVVTVR